MISAPPVVSRRDVIRWAADSPLARSPPLLDLDRTSTRYELFRQHDLAASAASAVFAARPARRQLR
jgi:hypothetical protein